MDNEKYQKNRNNVLNVSDKIKKIDLGDVLIGSSSQPLTTADYLIIGDYRSADTIVDVFDINTFEHVVSFGCFGNGPNEIAVFDNIAWRPGHRELYVTDAGKFEVFIYNIDSVITNKTYLPKRKNINPLKFATDNYFVNDSISYGVYILTESTTANTFIPCVGKSDADMETIQLLEYSHPNVDSKRISLAVSPRDSIYAECNLKYDLISIFNFDGCLLWNVYGENWGKSHTLNYMNAVFTKDFLIASYDGSKYEEHNPITKCHVFKHNGDYVATLDLKCNILRFCYDESHNRLIFCLNHSFQYGYLDLDEVFTN